MYEINSKWTKDLNVTNKTTKFLEENIKVNLHDLGLGKRFLDMTPTAWATKEVDKQISSKLKILVLQKTPWRKWKDSQDNRKTYLQIIYLLRSLYL